MSGTDDPVWGSTIDPVDRPDFRPEAVDVEGAVRRALKDRRARLAAKAAAKAAQTLALDAKPEGGPQTPP